MKTLKFLFITFALIGLSFQAMPQAASFETNTSSYKVYYVLDTVANSAAVTAVYPYVIPAGWSWSVQVVADSLSGATAGTAYLQSANGTTAGAVYETISSGSQVIDGVQTLKTWSSTTNWTGTKLRLYVTGGGTQSTKIRLWVVLKKLPLY